MKLPEFLEKQLVDFVRIYKKFYQKTFSVTLLLTIVFFLIGFVLFGASIYPNKLKVKPEILWSFFWNRYSDGGRYCLGDMIKIVFIFFIAFFALSFYKSKRAGGEISYFGFGRLFKGVSPGDLTILVAALLAACLADYLLVQLEYLSSANLQSQHSSWVIKQAVFHIRIFLPLLLFAFICAWRLGELEEFSMKKLLLAYIALWLFNEFSYETMVWARAHVFAVVLLPFYNTGYYFGLENILSIPVTAFYFLGYSSAMVNSLQILEIGAEDENLGILDGIGADN